MGTGASAAKHAEVAHEVGTSSHKGLKEALAAAPKNLCTGCQDAKYAESRPCPRLSAPVGGVVDHALRALSLKQLRLLQKVFVSSGWLQQRCNEFNAAHCGLILAGQAHRSEPDLYALDTFVVRPVTSPDDTDTIQQDLRSAAEISTPHHKCSFAELKNPHGMAIDLFVSHFWGHLFNRTMAALETFAANATSRVNKSQVSDISFWICLFAINQHSAGDEVGASLQDVPFNVALKKSCGVIMILDECANPFKRIWCLYEVLRAKDLEKPFEIITEYAPLSQKPTASTSHVYHMDKMISSLMTTSALSASSSNQVDKLRIWYEIANGWVRRAHTFDDFCGISDLTGEYFGEFDGHVGKLLATPLLKAAMAIGDDNAALQCTALGADAADALADMAARGLDLRSIRVKTKFAPGSLNLAVVMAEFCDLQGMGVLRDAGVDLDAADTLSWTPTIRAARKGDLNMLRFLCQSGVNMKEATADTFGWAPIHFAGQNGHVGVVRFLLEVNADIEVTNGIGWRTIHCAAFHGQVNVLELLRDSSAQLEATDLLGRTALHCAAQAGHTNALLSLQQAGCNMQVADVFDGSLRQLAAQNGHDEVLQFLQQMGWEAPTPKNQQKPRFGMVIKALQDIGINLEKPDESLFLAFHGHVRELKFLQTIAAESKVER